MSYIKKLHKRGLITPPNHVLSGIHYETMVGSIAYGVPTDISDVDIYGFAIPYLDMVFPHLAGEIQGFGRQIQRFQQYQQHHIKDESSGKEYDVSIYNIIKFFQLCMDNNPNMIDSLFTPQRCVLFCTRIGDMVREHRKLFLHKGALFKFKGYAFSQIHKMKTKNPEGKRKKMVEEFGYDVKFAYHVVRLLNEIEQILVEHDLDLERNREQLKSVKKGEWKEEEVYDYFNRKERDLETLYTNSSLRHSPKEGAIKELLLKCLEEHFGSLDKCVTRDVNINNVLDEMQTLITKYRG